MRYPNIESYVPGAYPVTEFTEESSDRSWEIRKDGRTQTEKQQLKSMWDPRQETETGKGHYRKSY